MKNKKTVEQRFWEKVGPHDDPTKCWLWTAGFVRNSNGTPYGTFRFGARKVRAHRFSYELRYGTIPEGLTIDHVRAKGCTSTLCVNPYHLEAVTIKVNVLRGDSFSAIEGKQTHCVHGHPFNKKNTYVRKRVGGGRSCLICHKIAAQKQRDIKKTQQEVCHV